MSDISSLRSLEKDKIQNNVRGIAEIRGDSMYGSGECNPPLANRLAIARALRSRGSGESGRGHYKIWMSECYTR